MRILILTYSYTPALTPRAFRWTAIAEWMATQGHHVEVVCAKSEALYGFEILNGVHVHRTGGSMRESLKTWLGRKPTTQSVMPAGTPQASTARDEFSRWLKRIYKLTLQKIMWPDFAGFWYFSALRKAKNLIENNIHDAIISVSVPFTGHLIGLSLHRKYSIPWVVDIGDPFSFMTETAVNNHELFNKLNFFYELKVLKGASLISVTTEETKTEYCKHFPSIEPNKISVIPPLFTTPFKQKDLPSFFPSKNKIRLVFAGTLYRQIRNPTALLEFFESLLDGPIGEHLELHFFGAINDCESCFDRYRILIGTKIFLHGLIAREDALRAMKEATILINIGNETTYQFPSKMIEYIMLAKPIIDISPRKLNGSQGLFSDLDSVFSVTERSLSSDLDVQARAKSFIENPPAVSLRSIAEFSETYSLDKIGKSYMNMLFSTLPS